MPTYVYECVKESKTFEVWQDFTDPTLTQCPECKGEVAKQYSGILYGAGTSLTRKGAKEAVSSARFEKRLEKDRPAYKAMKDQGLRPGKMIGAHELMSKARTKHEVESGKLMPQFTASQIESGVKEAEQALGHKIREVKPRIVESSQ